MQVSLEQITVCLRPQQCTDAIFIGANDMHPRLRSMQWSLEQITVCLRPQQFTDAIFVKAKVAHLSIV